MPAYQELVPNAQAQIVFGDVHCCRKGGDLLTDPVSLLSPVPVPTPKHIGNQKPACDLYSFTPSLNTQVCSGGTKCSSWQDFNQYCFDALDRGEVKVILRPMFHCKQLPSRMHGRGSPGRCTARLLKGKHPAGNCGYLPGHPFCVE